MNFTHTFLILLSGLAALILWLSLTRLILRKLRPESETDARLKPAYGLYYSGLLIAGFRVLATVLAQLSDMTNIAAQLNPGETVSEWVRLSLLGIGIGMAWLLLWLLVSRAVVSLLTGTIKETDEMTLGNTYYFLIKAVLLTGLVWLMDPLLLDILKAIRPQLPVPLIH